MKLPKELSDIQLLSLWRKTVLEIFDGRCFFCGAHYQAQEVECHHIIHRNHFLLRYSWRNGIPACRWNHSMNKHLMMPCHVYAETPEGKALANAYQKQFEEYITEKNGIAKQWLVKHGMTKEEYKMQMAVEMTTIWGIVQASRLNGSGTAITTKGYVTKGRQ